jgi:hypothetical protein
MSLPAANADTRQIKADTRAIEATTVSTTPVPPP